MGSKRVRDRFWFCTQSRRWVRPWILVLFSAESVVSIWVRIREKLCILYAVDRIRWKYCFRILLQLELDIYSRFELKLFHRYRLYVEGLIVWILVLLAYVRRKLKNTNCTSKATFFSRAGDVHRVRWNSEATFHEKRKKQSLWSVQCLRSNFSSNGCIFAEKRGRNVNTCLKKLFLRKRT